MSVMTVDIPRDRLGSYSLFAALLAAAGLPLYIHAPKFYVDSYGVSLAVMGLALFGLRLLDVVQDPFLGRLSERLRKHRAVAVAIGVAVLASAMVGLFAVEPPFDPLIWFVLMLAMVFSSFSFLTICFYAQGVGKAAQLGDQGHLRLARWRETGALLGICAAALAPFLLGTQMDQPFAGFAVGFVVVALGATLAMRLEWGDALATYSTEFGAVLRDPVARRLLIIACVNAAPVAVSSTLFLFFVESRLAAPGLEGPLLLLFFLAAAIAVPGWGKLAETIGAKNALLGGMVLAVLSFGFALTLGAGDWPTFALICVASGAALGADMTILPAMFAGRMAQVSPGAAEGFGLWSFVSKFTLAFAAVLLLPVLETAGFQSGTDNSDAALALLTLFYAGVPCVLKLIAIALLAMTKLEES